MPIVNVGYNAEKLDRAVLLAFRDELPILIASTLSTGKDIQGKLEAKDIEIEFKAFDSLSVHTKDVQVVVWALSFPERVANIASMTANLRRAIEAALPSNIKSFAFVLLSEGSFSESYPLG